MARRKRISEWRGIPVRYVDAGCIKNKRGSPFTVYATQHISYSGSGTCFWTASIYTNFGPAATGYSNNDGAHDNPTSALDSAFEQMTSKLRDDREKCRKLMLEIDEALDRCEKIGAAY